MLLKGISFRGPYVSISESESGEHNVKYFRNLLKSERARLNGLCSYWESTNDTTEDLTEEGMKSSV